MDAIKGRNTEHHREWRRAYDQRRYRRMIDWMRKFLGGDEPCCVACGAMEDLEFDHVNPATKVFTLTNGHKYPKAKIKDELAKCQLLCSECHDKKTAKERAVESPHGTINQYYNHRCRCELCRAAYSTYRKKLRARIVQSG